MAISEPQRLGAPSRPGWLARPRAGAWAWQAARAATLTIALSLPQGLLALPIAVAQVGLAPGLLILLCVGALNTVTIAWTARRTAEFFARHGAVPSLTVLAGERLGPGGRRLALVGGAGLFFLALLASLVGLGRSLSELGGLPAWLCCAGFGLTLFAVTGGGAALSTRLLTGLGLLNLGLLIALLLLLAPQARPVPASPPTPAAPAMMVGVSLMLFFAPMLTAPVARQVLPGAADARALVWGSAGGVALSTGLLALWAYAACGAASTSALAASAGTALPAVAAALPAGCVPLTLLGLLLLGMTALRCVLVLKTLVEELLPGRAWPGRRLVAQLPAGLGLVVALGLLVGGVSSFTQLIAVAGAGAASIVSLLIPALLMLARHPRRRGAA